MVRQADIDSLRHHPIPDQRLLIGGQWTAGRGDSFASISPINGERLAMVATALKADVDDAVNAARASFESGVWSPLCPRVSQTGAAQNCGPDRGTCAGTGRVGGAR